MVLTCEMCGASLDVNKAINDVVICEYCDSATNIHGIVRLNMSSDDRAAALMKRGFVFIEFRVWDKAKYVLGKAVNYDPENAKAYLGLLLVDTERTKEEQLASHREPLSDYENYWKALEFADEELKKRLDAYNDETLERKQERERRIQEREAREQKAREEKEEAAKKQKKFMVIVAVSILFIIAISTIVGLRARGIRLENERLALENLENFIDLAFIVDLASQTPEQREIDKKGFSHIRENTYFVEHNLREAAGFTGISLFTESLELQDVTRFAGIELGRFDRGLMIRLYEEYGIEAERVEHERTVTERGWATDTGSIVASHRRGFFCPIIVEIKFEKEGVQVLIIKNTELFRCIDTIRANPSAMWLGGGAQDMAAETTWTVIVGDSKR